MSDDALTNRQAYSNGSADDTNWQDAPEEAPEYDYAADDEVETPENEYDEGDDESEEQPEPEPEEAESRPLAPAYAAMPQGLPDQIAEDVRELGALMGEDGFGRLMRVLQYQQSQNDQYQSLAGWYVEQDARAHPGWHNTYGGGVQRILATMPPHQRGTQEALDFARLGVMAEELRQTGDFGATLRRQLRAWEGGQPQNAPRAPMPQNQRMPNASAAPAGRSAPRPSPQGAAEPSRSRATVESRLAKRFGKAGMAAILNRDR